MSRPREFTASRWQFFRYQLLGAGPLAAVLAGVALLTTILSGLQAWQAALLPPHRPAQPVLPFLPTWSPWVYGCIALACLVVILFEVAFRLWRSVLVGRNQRATLVNLWNDGAAIRNACLTRTLPNPEDALREWTHRLLLAVEKLDPSYIIEFQNQANLAMIEDGRFQGYPENDTYRQCYMWTVWRMEKLQALTEELRKGYVISMR